MPMQLKENKSASTQLQRNFLRVEDGTPGLGQYSLPIDAVGLSVVSTETPRERFQRLKGEWLRSIGPTDKLSDMYMLPAYQRILRLDRAAIPLLIQELRTAPNWWFWALEMITEQNPVSQEHLGNLRLMTKDWLDWADARGF